MRSVCASVNVGLGLVAYSGAESNGKSSRRWRRRQHCAPQQFDASKMFPIIFQFRFRLNSHSVSLWIQLSIDINAPKKCRMMRRRRTKWAREEKSRAEENKRLCTSCVFSSTLSVRSFFGHQHQCGKRAVPSRKRQNDTTKQCHRWKSFSHCNRLYGCALRVYTTPIYIHCHSLSPSLCLCVYEWLSVIDEFDFSSFPSRASSHIDIRCPYIMPSFLYVVGHISKCYN